tara:strand:- start:3844 stop:4467 length:624 start_codon:yes stop_codon:yes gene_type:complete
MTNLLTFSRQHPYVLIASITTIMAGILHAGPVAAEHASIPPEFWFLFLSGILQIAWGINYFYHRTPNMYFVGAVLNLGLTFFWLSVRLFPAPFSTAPEGVEMIGVVTAFIQIVAFAASFWSMYRFRLVSAFSVAFLLVLSLVLGGLGYVTAKTSEDALLKIWPDIQEGGHGHGEETEDDHDEETEGKRAEDTHPEDTPHTEGDEHQP